MSGKLPTYPSPKLTLTLTSHFRGGVGGQFNRNLNCDKYPTSNLGSISENPVQIWSLCCVGNITTKTTISIIFFFSRNVLLTNKGVTCYTIDNNNVETSTFTRIVSSVNFDIGPGTTCQHPAVSSVFKAFTANSYRYRS